MDSNQFNTGILIFNDIQTMDLAAPLEVFDQANFNVFTVAKSKQPVSTSSGQKLIPSYDFANHPPIEILVIPAGRDFELESDSNEIEWMRKTSTTADYILTICCGSIEYAKAGLLGKQQATTHHAYLEHLRKMEPQAEVVSDRKWVDNGKLITSGGLCSGIDAALHLVARIKGQSEAERIATWMEYPWTKEGTALAR